MHTAARHPWEWNGNRVGEIVVAKQPSKETVRHSFIEKDTVRLPNGVTIEGARGTYVSDYLAIGSLAVAVKHTGDYFNSYVPVTIAENQNSGVTITPFPDLRFGAYKFGETIGQLENADVQKIAAGLAIDYARPITAQASEDRATIAFA